MAFKARNTEGGMLIQKNQVWQRKTWIILFFLVILSFVLQTNRYYSAYYTNFIAIYILTQ